MIRKIARYQVKEAELKTVEQAIIEFVDAIARHEPHTVYEAYQSDDGVSFVHFMAFPDQEAEKAHQTAAYTMKFVEVLYPRCEETPAFTDLRLVGSSRPSA